MRPKLGSDLIYGPRHKLTKSETQRKDQGRLCDKNSIIQMIAHPFEILLAQIGERRYNGNFSIKN